MVYLMRRKILLFLNQAALFLQVLSQLQMKIFFCYFTRTGVEVTGCEVEGNKFPILISLSVSYDRLVSLTFESGLDTFEILEEQREFISERDCFLFEHLSR